LAASPPRQSGELASETTNRAERLVNISQHECIRGGDPNEFTGQSVPKSGIVGREAGSTRQDKM
jgi:hypothetical protein